MASCCGYSPLSDRAVKEAAALAQAVGAKIALLYAAPAYRMPVLVVR